MLQACIACVDGHAHHAAICCSEGFICHTSVPLVSTLQMITSIAKLSLMHALIFDVMAKLCHQTHTE